VSGLAGVFEPAPGNGPSEAGVFGGCGLLLDEGGPPDAEPKPGRAGAADAPAAGGLDGPPLAEPKLGREEPEPPAGGVDAAPLAAPKDGLEGRFAAGAAWDVSVEESAFVVEASSWAGAGGAAGVVGGAVGADGAPEVDTAVFGVEALPASANCV
jgi:hypothetical protein